jgi:RNA polymerase sigma-70 factor (ECF subfamily)
MGADRAAVRIEPGTTSSDFDALVRTHAEAVWRSLRAMGVHASAIDDAAQDVFVIAFRQWEHYREQGTARSWLFAISRRVAANYRRRAPRASDDASALAEHEVGADEAVALREARLLVDEFLTTVSEERKLVFYLSDIEGWSAPEVAEALEVNLNTVYSRLRRAREQFERYLQRKGVRR